jgi:L-lactate utilization protein LutC
MSTEKTRASLTSNNFEAIEVATKAEALEKVRSLIPEGVSIMNGTSETLRQIGFIDYLKEGAHPWKNLHDVILAENDPEKQGRLRRESVVSDYYVGSVHAVTENGELVIASNTGSQLSHLVYTSPNIILVVGKNKIVPSLKEAFERIDAHVIPLEDKRMHEVYGFGTTHAKTLILHRENPAMGRKIRVVIVDEDLGF